MDCSMSSYYEKILATGEVKCIDEEIPFEIPKGWEWCKINNIAFVTKLAGFEYTKYIAGNLKTNGIPLFKGKNVQGGKIIYEFEAYIPESLSDELERSQISKKCLLTPYVGTIGNIGLHNKSGKFHLGSNVGKIEILNPVSQVCILEEFVHIYLLSQYGYAELTKYKKATAQESISIEAIRDVLLPIPPTLEQQKIVDKYYQLETFADKYSKLQGCLDKLNTEIFDKFKKSVLQEAIQGKLVKLIAEEGTAQELLEQIMAEKEKLVKEGKLKKSALNDSVIFRGDDNKYWEKSGDSIVCIDEEIPFGIPSSWSWCRLGNIASVKGGKRIPVGEKLTTENTGHMYIRVADMKENTVKTDDIHYISESIYQKIKSYTISTEDLYITVAGTIGSVGEIPKVFDNANLTENADKIVFRGICKKFLMHCLLSNFVQSQIKKCTTKVGQPKLAIVRIEDLLIPLPPIKEQYRIVHKIEQTASIMS